MKNVDRLTICATELPEVLGIGRNTAYELVKRDDFPSIRIGRRIVIPVDALREWLKKEAKNGSGIKL